MFIKIKSPPICIILVNGAAHANHLIPEHQPRIDDAAYLTLCANYSNWMQIMKTDNIAEIMQIYPVKFNSFSGSFAATDSGSEMCMQPQVEPNKWSA